MLEDQPFRVFGPSSGSARPSLRFSSRRELAPSTSALPSPSQANARSLDRRGGGELADDLLDDVLERDQPLELAVLVDDEREALPVLLEVLELRERRRGRPDEVGFGEQLLERALSSSPCAQ